jgi:hypothetical protein
MAVIAKARAMPRARRRIVRGSWAAPKGWRLVSATVMSLSFSCDPRAGESGAVLTVPAGSRQVRPAMVPLPWDRGTSHHSVVHRTTPPGDEADGGWIGSTLSRGRPGANGGVGAVDFAAPAVALAQSAEHRNVDPKVTGSRPVGHPNPLIDWLRAGACPRARLPRGGSSRGHRAPPDRVRPPVRSHRRGDDVCAEGLNRDNEAEGRALGALPIRRKTFHVPGRDPRSSSIRVTRRVRPAPSGPAWRARAEASGRRLLRWLRPIRGCRARPRRHADGHVRAGLR